MVIFKTVVSLFLGVFFFLVWWYPGSVLTVFLHSLCVASLLTKKSDSMGNGWLRFCQSDASPMRQDGLRRSVTLFIHTDSFRRSSTMLREGIKGFGQRSKNLVTRPCVDSNGLNPGLHYDRIFSYVQLSVRLAHQLDC